jgi:hypothetical protein
MLKFHQIRMLLKGDMDSQAGELFNGTPKKLCNQKWRKSQVAFFLFSGHGWPLVLAWLVRHKLGQRRPRGSFFRRVKFTR